MDIYDTKNTKCIFNKSSVHVKDRGIKTSYSKILEPLSPLVTVVIIIIIIIILVANLMVMVILHYQERENKPLTEYYKEPPGETIELSILSYNILFQHYPHGIMNILGLDKQPSDWELRRESVKNIIHKRQPDISCFQEARSDHPNFPSYSQNSDMRYCWEKFVAFGPPGYGTTGIYNPDTVSIIGDYMKEVDYLGHKFVTSEQGIIRFISNPNLLF